MSGISRTLSTPIPALLTLVSGRYSAYNLQIYGRKVESCLSQTLMQYFKTYAHLLTILTIVELKVFLRPSRRFSVILTESISPGNNVPSLPVRRHIRTDSLSHVCGMVFLLCDIFMSSVSALY